MFKYTLFAFPASLLLFLAISLAQAKAPVQSPEAHTELICHTNHASECYPSIFQPTIHFKRVYDDQFLPPGLHIRMNLSSGLKEARLNVPESDRVPKADLVIIDDVKPRPMIEEKEVEEEDEGIGFEVEEHAPPAERIHDQSIPDRDYPYMPDVLDAEESSLFHTMAANFLSSAEPSALLTSLTNLIDICHSYHWGLTLTRSVPIVEKLFSTLNPPLSAPKPDSPPSLRSHAALLLATAIQNNPEARDALLTTISREDALQAILSTFQEATTAAATTEVEETANHQRRTLFLLNQLSYDHPFLRIFLSSSGLQNLHTLLSPSLSTHPKLRLRMSHFLIDHAIPTLIDSAGPQYEFAIEIAKATVPGGIPSPEEARSRRWAGDLDEGERALMVLFEPWRKILAETLMRDWDDTKYTSEIGEETVSESHRPDQGVGWTITTSLMLKIILETDVP